MSRDQGVTIIPAGESEYDPDLEEALDEFRSSVGDTQEGATLRVYRVPTDEMGNMRSNGTNAFLFSVPMDVFKLDEIIHKVRTQFMYPDDKIVFVRLMASRKGKRGIEMNKVISIMRAQDTPRAEGVTDTSQILRTVGEMIGQQNTRFEQMFMRLAESNRPAVPVQKDPMEIANGMMASMATMMGMIFSKMNPPAPAAPGGSMLEQIQALTLLKKLADPEERDTPSDREPSGMDIALEGLKRLPSVLGAISQAQSARQHLASPQMRVRQVPPNSAPSQNAAAETPAVQTPPAETAAPKTDPLSYGDNMILAALQQHLPTFIQVADNGGDPKEVANMVVEQIPESLDEQFLAFITHPQVLNRLKMFAPDIGKTPQREKWFEDLIAAILEHYPEDAAEGGTPA